MTLRQDPSLFLIDNTTSLCLGRLHGLSWEKNLWNAISRFTPYCNLRLARVNVSVVPVTKVKKVCFAAGLTPKYW